MFKLLARLFSGTHTSQPADHPQQPSHAIDLLSLVTDREQLETERENAGEHHNEVLKRIVAQHVRVLGKKIRQTIRQDEYGKETGLDEAGEVISYFVSRVAKAEPEYLEARQRVIDTNLELTLYGHDRDQYDLHQLSEDIAAEFDENLIAYIYVLATGGSAQSLEVEDIDALSGESFELHCEERLRSLGWSVCRKAGTGDQGVDLLVGKDGALVAIQCKRYSGSVGNQAVQQVEAGRQYEEADIAAVVSNSVYTPSAQQLAAKLGVILMHASELDLLEQRVASSGRR